MPEDRAIDERDIRIWFMKTELEQARDTYRVVEGILQVRMEAQPELKKRKKRSDAGVARDSYEDIGAQDRKAFESTQG